MLPSDTKYAYNIYKGLPLYAYKCIQYLQVNEELMWKLLKYNTPDAWDKPDLSFEEKAGLVYAGQEDETLFRVFLDEGQIDAWTHECSIVRIFPYTLYPENRTTANITLAIDIHSHYKVNHLSNYQTRIDTISQRLIENLNGVVIEGIGQIFFDVLGGKEERAFSAGQIPYKGRRMLFGNKAQ